MRTCCLPEAAVHVFVELCPRRRCFSRGSAWCTLTAFVHRVILPGPHLFPPPLPPPCVPDLRPALKIVGVVAFCRKFCCKPAVNYTAVNHGLDEEEIAFKKSMEAQHGDDIDEVLTRVFVELVKYQTVEWRPNYYRRTFVFYCYVSVFIVLPLS